MRRFLRQCQQNAFGKQLPKDAESRRHERPADRELFLTLGASRQQQIRYVQTRDQQHERHRREQCPYGRSQAMPNSINS